MENKAVGRIFVGLLWFNLLSLIINKIVARISYQCIKYMML